MLLTVTIASLPGCHLHSEASESMPSSDNEASNTKCDAAKGDNCLMEPPKNAALSKGHTDLNLKSNPSSNTTGIVLLCSGILAGYGSSVTHNIHVSLITHAAV